MGDENVLKWVVGIVVYNSALMLKIAELVNCMVYESYQNKTMMMTQ